MTNTILCCLTLLLSCYWSYFVSSEKCDAGANPLLCPSSKPRFLQETWIGEFSLKEKERSSWQRRQHHHQYYQRLAEDEEKGTDYLSKYSKGGIDNTTIHSTPETRKLLHAVLMTIPCYGHFNQIKSIGVELLSMGHAVTLFIEEGKETWCDEMLSSLENRRNRARNDKIGANEDHIENHYESFATVSEEPLFQCRRIPISPKRLSRVFENISKMESLSASNYAVIDELLAYATEESPVYAMAFEELVLGTRSEDIDRFMDGKRKWPNETIVHVPSSKKRFPSVSIILTDSATLTAPVIAKRYRIPIVYVNPTTLNSPFGSATDLPVMGTGDPSGSGMSLFHRVHSHFIRTIGSVFTNYDLYPQLRSIRENFIDNFDPFGIPSIDRGGYVAGRLQKNSRDNSLTIVSSIWGFDISQKICPNIIAIGSLAMNSYTNGRRSGDDERLELDRILKEHYHHRLRNAFKREVGISQLQYDGNTEIDASSGVADDLELLRFPNVRMGTYPSSYTPSDPSDDHDIHPPTSAALSQEQQINQFLSNNLACTKFGAVYVNFGTLAVLSDSSFAKLRKALMVDVEPNSVSENTMMMPLCVVWKVPEYARMISLRMHVNASLNDTEEANMADIQIGRYFITQRFDNPETIMNHRSVAVFISHCGDTSVLEAIRAQLPIVGIPFFADQGDVCQRVEEAGIGRRVPGGKFDFSVEGLQHAIREVGGISITDDTGVMDGAVQQPKRARHHFLRKLALIRHISDLLGGSREAARIISRHYELGLLQTPMTARDDGTLMRFIQQVRRDRYAHHSLLKNEITPHENHADSISSDSEVNTDRFKDSFFIHPFSCAALYPWNSDENPEEYYSIAGCNGPQGHLNSDQYDSLSPIFPPMTALVQHNIDICLFVIAVTWVVMWLVVGF